MTLISSPAIKSTGHLTRKLVTNLRALRPTCALAIASAGLAGPGEADPADGWEHVERPNWGVTAPGLESRGVSVPAAVLPPPPTEPELIEQWTRAMFTDHVGPQPRDGAPQVPGAQCACPKAGCPQSAH